MAKRILILDDEELITRTLIRLLEKSGYQVMVAKSGQDAIAIAEEEDFDLIISDIRMPGVNGLEAMKIIRKNKRIPTIFITGYADPNLEKEAQQTAPVAYIYKPFDVSDLMGKVKEALGE